MPKKIDMWIETSTKKLFSTRIFELIESEVSHKEKEEHFTVWNLHSNDFCNIVPLILLNQSACDAAAPKAEDYGILLIKQFRFGNRQMTIEIPGGIVEDDEDPVEAGKRELREETGYSAERIEVFTTLAPNPAIMDNTAHLLLAFNCSKKHETDFDDMEEIETEVVAVKDVQKMLADGTINHSIVVATLMLAFDCLNW